VNAQTEETQETALTLACCGGFLEIAELLINAGANLELGCSTPLMEAAQEGHVDLVKYLISSGWSECCSRHLVHWSCREDLTYNVSRGTSDPTNWNMLPTSLCSAEDYIHYT